MSRVALRTASSVLPDDPIAGFPTTTVATLERVLATTAAGLLEPITADPRRALTLLDPLVETLTGFVIGSVADGLVLAVRRWFGFAAADALRVELARRWPIAPFGRDDAPARYLVDADARPLVDAIAARLHARLCRVAPALRMLIERVVVTIARVAPHRRHALAGMLHQVQRDELIGDRIADEITFGWLTYAAVIARTSRPSTAGRPQRSAALWSAWVSRLANLGRAPVADTCSSETTPAGTSCASDDAPRG